MDLGATICTPKRPSCLMCPLQIDCAAHALGIEAALPARAVKADRPNRYGVAFLAVREDGHMLLRRRPNAGLLGGMLEVPSTDWADEWVGADEALRSAPVRGNWLPVPGSVSHTFTHFKLTLMVYQAVVPSHTALNLWTEPERCRWVHRRDLDTVALPSVMHKVIAHALGAQ
jgi:A/G-specific adenine glycosylase